MRLLVLGGTQFVGHAVVVAALDQGHEVTTFNRGLSGEDVHGVVPVRGDRYDPVSLADLARQGPWDAMVDTSGYVPRNVLEVARSLRLAVGHCVFMSTVSVYADWPIRPLTDDSPVLECPPDAGPDFGVDVEDGPTRYGYQKAGCEAAVESVYGDQAATLRPGVVLGPREYIGRLPWWLQRIRRGGRVLAPGSPERGIQPVDVRDLASFAVLAAEHRLSRSFNVTASIDGETFGGLLRACTAATGVDADIVWVADDVLRSHGVRQWSELPLWRTFDGVWRVDSERARSAGLACRPLADTVADTWRWLISQDQLADNDRAQEVGIDPTRENLVLASVAPPDHVSKAPQQPRF
jgi:2'-hydroxyisoflavone reductase